jgi:hypothetical protein
MNHQLINLFAATTALIVGGLIGAGFGRVQDVARRRNEKRERDGDLKTGWAVMPGSGARVAYLLIALVIIQILCPLLFQNNIQWWVSGGVVGGYGLTLFKQLRQRVSQNK